MPFSDKVNFIWSIAELLRGDYKASEYGRVILPLVVLRRLDSVLEPTKEAVLVAVQRGTPELALQRVARQSFYNTSALTFRKLLDDPGQAAANLRSYINGFSPTARETFEKFDFDAQISKLEEAGVLFQVLQKFAAIDLHPDTVSNREMGYVFEELIRRFSEQSNETAGGYRDAFLAALGETGTPATTNEAVAAERLDSAFRRRNLEAATPVRKALLDALAVRDESATPVLRNGKPVPDPDLRDTENVPLKEDVHTYFQREVLPYVPNAWIDENKTRIGYEIPFTRHFYQYTPPRPLEQIDAEIKALEAEILAMLREVTA